MRIPRKNIKAFHGKPIISYSIEVAQASMCFEKVMVSTDDDEIATIARSLGAEVPFMRSAKTSDHHSTLNDVLEEVVEGLRSIGQTFEFGCCILPTAPLITVQRLKQGYELLLKNDFDSVRPIVRFGYPIQRAFRMTDSNHVSFFNPEFATTRSQDLEPAYHDAGQFYWFKTDKLLKGSNKGGFVISNNEVQDIDTTEDWEIAEFKYKYYHKEVSS